MKKDTQPFFSRITHPYRDVPSCVDDIIQKVGKEIILCIPPGLGQPSPLTNAFYNRAKSDPSICASSRPRPEVTLLEQRMLQVFQPKGGVPNHSGAYSKVV